jgi:hypothetical protein
MSAHTSGPWSVENWKYPNSKEVSRRDGIVTIVTESDAIAQLCNLYRPDDDLAETISKNEVMANARLIASAPELLDACRVALSVFKAQFPYEHGNPEVGCAWGALEHAIAKATNNQPTNQPLAQPMKTFPNGFESWHETHYEIVSAITARLIADDAEACDGLIRSTLKEKGHGGLYELASDLTDEFENLHRGREWDGEFFDEIENFMDKKLN